jgi:hypothetical protein
MLFQYLVNTLEADFVPRQIATKGKLLTNLVVYIMAFICLHSEEVSYQFSDCVTESLDWVIFRESLLSMLLV